MSRPWATPQRHIPGRPYGWLVALVPVLMNLGLALVAVAAHRPVLAAVALLAAVPVFLLSVLVVPR
jgi:hypothetical protein